MQQLKKMGPIGQLLDLMPGMGGAAKEAQQAVDRGDLKRVEAIIQSMTIAERRDPDLLGGSRKRRVARGSGTSLQEVNRLLKQFAEMKKLMRQFSGAGAKRSLLPFGRR
jgi:signal recognition particle subunit SRP54